MRSKISKYESKTYDGYLGWVCRSSGMVFSPDFVDDKGKPVRCGFRITDVWSGKDLLECEDTGVGATDNGVLRCSFVPEKYTATLFNPQMEIVGMTQKRDNHGKPVFDENGQPIMQGEYPKKKDGRVVWNYVECGTAEKFKATHIDFYKL